MLRSISTSWKERGKPIELLTRNASLAAMRSIGIRSKRKKMERIAKPFAARV